MKYFRLLLFPFAIVYDTITSLRNFLYNHSILKSTSFSIPVIVVGNLSVGGTGKTPQIEYLTNLLKDTFKTAILSRGYKRKSKGFVLINKMHTILDTGDEPLQYFNKFNNVTVAVDANRVAGVKKLKNMTSPEVILLDDAYQHRKIKGSYYVLLTKFNDLFVNDYLLPMGNLRESRRGANRADIIIVSKCPNNLSDTHQKQIKLKLEKYQKKVFFTKISYEDRLFGDDKILIKDLSNYQVLLITGIANPTSLLVYLQSKNIVYQHLKYADHHNFSNYEIEKIRQKFAKIKSKEKIILTTEKDYTRLKGSFDKLSYIGIKTTFLGNQHTSFDSEIKKHIKEF